MNNREYAALPGLNWSTLKKISVSPAYLRHMLDHPEEDGDKAAFRQGRATHCATLEPERFRSDYVVEPDFDQIVRGKYGDLRTKAAREERDQIRKEWEEKYLHEDVELISQEEFDTALRCAKAVRKNKAAEAILDGAEVEQPLTWYNPETGLECKGRIDIISGGRIVDLKTTRRASVREILRDAATYDYHGQVAWYHDGAVLAKRIEGDIPPAGIFVHAPKGSTFVDVAVLDMASAPWALEEGRKLYKKLITQYMGCQVTDWWPGMADSPIAWTVPEWKTEEWSEEI